MFDDDEGRMTPVYDRATLAPGSRLTGPAIIEQMDATTPLWPGDTARVDEAGNILIELGG